MAVELGTAYLSLVAETKDFAKTAKKALGDLEQESVQTGKSSGSKLGAGIATGMKVAGGAIAGVAALVGGMAIKGGIDRALAIEDAQAKLKGLGHDAESITAIMGSALDSVRGTAFGLGDAAGVAATVVAAGVQPGEDLTRTLKLVADASTIAGTSMGDMGAIFNKVAGTGKIQGEVIAQLGERGIPILALLADELGVTAGEVAALASSGKIDFATFQNAMEAGMGGAALASGDTFRGAMANAMAALGRLGENVVSGVLPQIKDGFGDAISVLDSWAPQAEAAGAAIGAALSTTVEWIRGDLVPALQSMVEWIRQNSQWLGPLVVAIGAGVVAWKAYILVTQTIPAILAAARVAMLGLNAAMRANPVGLVVTAIGALVAGLVWFFTQTETGRKIVQVAWGAIQTAISAVVGWVTGAAVPWITGAWDTIAGAAQALWSKVTGAWDAIVSGVKSAVALVAAVLQAYAQGWTSIITGALSAIQSVWSSVWGAISGVVSAVWAVITAAITSRVNAARAVVTSVVNAIRSVVSSVFSAVGGVVSSTWNRIYTSIATPIQRAYDTVSGVVSRIKNLFAGAGSWLVSAGRSIIDGLIKGITEKIKSVTSTLKNLTKNIPNWKGPASVDRHLLTDNGRLIMGSLVTGLRAGQKDVRRELLGLTADLPSQVAVNANLEPRGVGAEGAELSPRVVQHVTVNYPVAEPQSTAMNRALQYAGALGEA